MSLQTHIISHKLRTFTVKKMKGVIKMPAKLTGCANAEVLSGHIDQQLDGVNGIFCEGNSFHTHSVFSQMLSYFFLHGSGKNVFRAMDLP